MDFMPQPADAGKTQNNNTKTEFLPAGQVWRRYGVTSMSLWRWVKDETLGFPKPFYIGRYRYWRLADIEAWESAQSVRAVA
ncbi:MULTISPECIES: hypothetical protein [unclassified Mesorhizobium]|uniref:helix-turn-helix transcriptional regulator n=1 Tax=unclassified Mesorhizobium TaxID=325217 RepID=UPI0003CE6B4E|nr:hypothetical protein [Mesorhizobium sp. LSJC255A00]ESX12017.1 hypothetical protein X766_31085 [Mesorhizobium sp. LSJC255A00]